MIDESAIRIGRKCQNLVFNLAKKNSGSRSFGIKDNQQRQTSNINVCNGPLQQLLHRNVMHAEVAHEANDKAAGCFVEVFDKLPA